MIISIQYLRAFAALFVLLSHVAWKNMQHDGTLLIWWHEAGAFGVDIFFVISGFIMAYTTQNMHQKEGAAKLFLQRRAVRILPLYWLITAISLLMYLLFPERVNSSGGETTILKSFFLLPVTKDELYLVNVGWTLRYEFIFYILFAIGLFFHKKIGTMLVVGMIVSLFVLYGIVDLKQWNDLWDNFISDLFLEFAFGMGLFYLFKRQKLYRSLSIIAIVLGFVLFINAFTWEILTTDIRAIDTGIAAFLICYGFISQEEVLAKHPVSLMRTLGDSSYSLYLLHPLILAFVVLVYDKLGFFAIKSETLFTASMIIPSLVGGYICYRFIETPMNAKVKSYFGR